jgi:hypothetical protein
MHGGNSRRCPSPIWSGHLQACGGNVRLPRHEAAGRDYRTIREVVSISVDDKQFPISGAGWGRVLQRRAAEMHGDANGTPIRCVALQAMTSGQVRISALLYPQVFVPQAALRDRRCVQSCSTELCSVSPDNSPARLAGRTELTHEKGAAYDAGEKITEGGQQDAKPCRLRTSRHGRGPEGSREERGRKAATSRPYLCLADSPPAPRPLSRAPAAP